VSGADDVGSQKRDLRALVRAARDALPAETREALGARVAERLFSVPGFVDAGTVLAFSSFGSEVPTAPILDRLHRQGRRVALPRVRAEAMEARGYRPGDPMTVARFGALEPVEGERLAPEEFDAVIVPGLAFDRFLERVRADALTVGICFAIQLVDRIPTEAHDIAVRWVVTDEEAIRT
jgi:5-formyltetrahydrofolate cyclo-ligase